MLVTAPINPRSHLRRGLRKTIVTKKRGFFDKWSTYESELLRQEIVENLHQSSYEGDTYSFFSGLGPLSLSDSIPQSSVYRAIQLRALFSKDVSMCTPHDRRMVALQSFVESEASCKSTNDIFRLHSYSSEVASVIFYAQQKIASVLGDVPLIKEIPMDFGPGASADTRGKTSRRWKISNPPSISTQLLRSGFLNRYLAQIPHWIAHHKKCVIKEGNLEFVPKNYKTDRSIVIEPSLNGYIQKGIGTILKQKLLAVGVDLRDQSVNRERARISSVDGRYATIDLSAASDSIAHNLVMELLPIPWFELLSSCRTDSVTYQSNTFALEKFSSMGNGYTFELESLIFWALSFGISRLHSLRFDVTVYGDDIICNPELASRISEIFPQFGFKVNDSKSYFNGNFRESCGFDALLGVDVRPFFLKDKFSCHTVVSMFNFLTRKPWFDPDGEIRRILLRTLPSRYRIYGPDGYGDGHLVGRLHRCLQRYRKRGYSGFTFFTHVELSHKDESTLETDHISCLPNTLFDRSEVRPWFDLHKDIPGNSFFSLRRPKGLRRKHKKVRVYVLGM